MGSSEADTAPSLALHFRDTTGPRTEGLGWMVDSFSLGSVHTIQRQHNRRNVDWKLHPHNFALQLAGLVLKYEEERRTRHLPPGIEESSLTEPAELVGPLASKKSTFSQFA